MPMNAARLAELMRKKNLKFFVDPENPAVTFGARGMNGKYMFVIKLEMDGIFMQARTLDYMTCPADHENLLPVLRTLGALNYKMRFVKFAWDPADGEIVVYADVWIMDGEITKQQFDRALDNYLPSVDIGYGRIKAAMETGVDPGEKSAMGLPPQLEKLLADLKKKKEEEERKKKKFL